MLSIDNSWTEVMMRCPSKVLLKIIQGDKHLDEFERLWKAINEMKSFTYIGSHLIDQQTTPFLSTLTKRDIVSSVGVSLSI